MKTVKKGVRKRGGVENWIKKEEREKKDKKIQ